jgi:subtilisin family serine protease
MTSIRRGFLRIAAGVVALRVTKTVAMSATGFVSILTLLLGASVVLTTAAEAGPGPTPTATATPTPICLEPPAACQNNNECCSNICSGQSGNKTCQPEPPSAPAPTPTPEESASPRELFENDYDQIVRILRSEESEDIIVEFEVSKIRMEAMDRAEAKGLSSMGLYELLYQREEYAIVKQKGLDGLEGVTVLRDYENLPTSFVRISDVDTLNALLERPEVRAVYKARTLKIGMNESLRLIGQNLLHGYEKDGTGTVVAVLDTGVEHTRAPFNCTSPGVPAGECRVVKSFDATPVDDGNSDPDPDSHGTNVSAVIAYTATGADLWVADVCDDQSGCHDDHIRAAISQAVTDKVEGGYNIVAINISLWLAGVRQWEHCSGSLGADFQTALDWGIQPITITGNGANVGQVPAYGASWPGCLPQGFTVGAVYDDNLGHYQFGDHPLIDPDYCEDLDAEVDEVACFSQSFGGLDLYAPGVEIEFIDGEPTGNLLEGTSFAAPHVAGAWAILRQEFPEPTTNDEIRTLLQSYGPEIDDYRFGLDPLTRRLDIFAIFEATVLPEPNQLLTLGSGILALWGLSTLRVRRRG